MHLRYSDAVINLTYQDLVEMLKGLLAGLENALSVVDAAGVSLQAQENLPRGSGAVHAARSPGKMSTVGMFSHTYPFWNEASHSQRRSKTLEASEVVTMDVT
jgi:hypothetical protein